MSTLAQKNGTAIAKLGTEHLRKVINEQHNSCERSCLRHGRRNGYCRWTNRAQRADLNYFCGSKCKEKFDLNPEQYLGKSAGTAKSGHGCCS